MRTGCVTSADGSLTMIMLGVSLKAAPGGTVIGFFIVICWHRTNLSVVIEREFQPSSSRLIVFGGVSAPDYADNQVDDDHYVEYEATNFQPGGPCE